MQETTWNSLRERRTRSYTIQVHGQLFHSGNLKKGITGENDPKHTDGERLSAERHLDHHQSIKEHSNQQGA